MNPIKKGTPVEINGVVYQLVFDFEAFATAEELTGQALLSRLSQIDVARPSLNFFRAMFYASAKPFQPELTFAQAKCALTADNGLNAIKLISHVWPKVLEALAGSVPEPEPEAAKAEETENPTQGQS